MYETEVKVPADLARARRRLESLDTECRGSTDQADTYFDHPNRSFAETDEALRIRRTETSAVLTYKGPKVDDTSKTRREVQTSVGDPEVTQSLLVALDFEPVAEVSKRRTSYEVDGYEVTLDEIDGVGEFVEVEATSERADIDDLRAGAEDVLEQLGLEPADQVRTSYLELSLDTQQ